jgi:D-aminopeptidase
VRVHVISDMEGVAGIVKCEQTTGGESLYEEGRKLYTEERPLISARMGRPSWLAISRERP